MKKLYICEKCGQRAVHDRKDYSNMEDPYEVYCLCNEVMTEVTSDMNETCYKKVEEEQVVTPEPKLLTIELDDLSSIPTVIYNGEDITNRTRIDFSWITRKDDSVIIDSPYINLEYYEKDKNDKYHLKRISFNMKQEDKE